jgi:hypothetical protein
MRAATGIDDQVNAYFSDYDFVVVVATGALAEDLGLFDLLKRAYIEARYSPGYRITQDELRALQDRVLDLARRVREACADQQTAIGGGEAVTELPRWPGSRTPSSCPRRRGSMIPRRCRRGEMRSRPWPTTGARGCAKRDAAKDRNKGNWHRRRPGPRPRSAPLSTSSIAATSISAAPTPIASSPAATPPSGALVGPGLARHLCGRALRTGVGDAPCIYCLGSRDCASSPGRNGVPLAR